MPGLIEEAERPETPQSGVPLETEYNVQHRSDILMEEHIQNVKSTQDTLKQALFDLENAKSAEEIDTCRVIVQDLRQKSEYLVTCLQVMHKLNLELAYARADLEDALHHNQGDINAARKRVIWLEDRMGNLCGKKKLKSRPTLPEIVGYNAAKQSERFPTNTVESSDKYTLENDLKNIERSANLTSGSEPLPITQVKNQSTQVKSQSQPLMISVKGESDQQLHQSQQISPIGIDIPSLEQRNKVETSSGQSMMCITIPSSEQQESASLNDKEEIEQSMKDEEIKKTKSDTDNENISQKTADTDLEQGRLVSEENIFQGKTAVTTESSQSVGELVVDFPGNMSLSHSLEESGSTGGSEKEDKEVEEQTEERAEERKEKTFITEVGVLATPKSKVTILSPPVDVGSTAPFMTEGNHDLGQEYWQSEHHRFEHGEFSEVLCELDPLSYHQMGLAVPGSFLQKDDSDFQELPWQVRRKGSDIKDIHRIALDKLAIKVHSMYDKVYNAAMISVKPKQRSDDGLREASFLQSLDSHLSSKSVSGKTGTLPPTAESAKPQTAESFQLPKVGGRRIGTTGSGRMVYYPKPIPPPAVLPITRTSKNKEFPKFASSFVDLDSEPRKPAKRIVDQRNLMEETKLVLYKEKPKPKVEGPSLTERRFRMMLEREMTVSSKASSRKLKNTFAAAQIVARLQGENTESENSGISDWRNLKPQSHGREYSGLRWERVKNIVHSNLVSDRQEERRDAAKQLGLLRCGDTMVFFALKERLLQDEDQRVRYESAKSLILIGCWEDEVLQVILKYLVIGNTEIRLDLIQTMAIGKNVQYVEKSIPVFPELVKVLSHFCRNPDPEDPIAFEAAVLLGRLCVADDNAKQKLKNALTESQNSHIKSKAVEILIKQLNCSDADVVRSVQDIFRTSPVWKDRHLAAKLLISLGPEHPCVQADSEKIYEVLERRLWDDPNKEVRTSAAKALTALGMFARASETIEKRLEDPDEDARAQAAIAVGTLGMKGEKVIRLLLEMLELDSSDYVRLMIIRSFANLKLTDKRVLRTLCERERLEGPLAREARKALQVLEAVYVLGTPKSGTPKSYTHKQLTAKAIASRLIV